MRRVEVEPGFGIEIMARRVPENVVLRNIIDENYCPSRFKVHERLNDFALIVSGFFWKISRQDSTKRNFATREYRKGRKKNHILSALSKSSSTFEISRLLRVKKGEHFFFLENYAIAYFHKYIITYMLTARSQIIEWKLVDSLSPRKTGIVGGISAEPRVYWICSTFFFLIFPWKSNPILVVEASAPHFLVSCFFFRHFARNTRIYTRKRFR